MIDPRAKASLVVLGCSLAAAGCPSLAQTTGPQALAIMPGVINRTDNKSLRFALLKYGLETFCQEMTKRGAPLKLADDQPSVGRFYPQRCDTRLIEDEANKSFLVQFFGSGYAWTNITRRLGFDAAGVIEYDPDFLLDDSSMYLYFRTKHIAATRFQAGMIENAPANAPLVVPPRRRPSSLPSGPSSRQPLCRTEKHWRSRGAATTWWSTTRRAPAESPPRPTCSTTEPPW